MSEGIRPITNTERIALICQRLRGASVALDNIEDFQNIVEEGFSAILEELKSMKWEIAGKRPYGTREE